MGYLLLRLLIVVLGTIVTVAILGFIGITVAWWIVAIIWVVLVFLGELVLDGDWT